MNNPKISWQVREIINEDENNYEYIQYKSYTEEGSFVPGNYIQKSFRVWNNHNGKIDVNDAKDCSLILAFKNFEDSFLLHLMQVNVDGVNHSVLDIDIDRAVVNIGDLSGVANSGTENNSTNYRDITITIGPIPNNIKSDLKGLYLYLEFLNE